MKKLITLSALASTLLVTGLANAATTTELKVTGVIRPAACVPSFTGGGTVDYGVIPPNTLSATAPTALAAKTIPFSVTCDAATKISLRALDNRKTSIVAGLAAAATAAGTIPQDHHAFGLGTAGGKNIGVYTVRTVQSSFTADGTSPDVLTIRNTDATVFIKTEGGHFHNDGGSAKAFGAAGTTTPTAYKTLSGNLAIQVVIDKTSNLDLTSDINLNGSTTIEVKYL